MKKKSDKLAHAGYQYYLHSQYPSKGVDTTFYYRCIHIRKLCSLKMSLKDGKLTVKEYHTCVKEKQSVVLDATQRMSDLSLWLNQQNQLSKLQMKLWKRSLRNMKVCLNTLFGHFE